jgi:hypothetical protein
MSIGEDKRRVILEITRSQGGFEGTLLDEGADEPVVFTGWLELLTLLETPHPARNPSRLSGGRHVSG